MDCQKKLVKYKSLAVPRIRQALKSCLSIQKMERNSHLNLIPGHYLNATASDLEFTSFFWQSIGPVE